MLSNDLLDLGGLLSGRIGLCVGVCRVVFSDRRKDTINALQLCTTLHKGIYLFSAEHTQRVEAMLRSK